MKFVDRGRYKRGIDMDVYNQLLTVALKKGAAPDYKAMAEGITKAGYAPMEWFMLDKGKLKSTPFGKPVKPKK